MASSKVRRGGAPRQILPGRVPEEFPWEDGSDRWDANRVPLHPGIRIQLEEEDLELWIENETRVWEVAAISTIETNRKRTKVKFCEEEADPVGRILDEHDPCLRYLTAPELRLLSLLPSAKWRLERQEKRFNVQRFLELLHTRPHRRTHVRKALQRLARETIAKDGLPVWHGSLHETGTSIEDLYWATSAVRFRWVYEMRQDGYVKWDFLNEVEEVALGALGENLKEKRRRRQEREEAEIRRARERSEERGRYIAEDDQDPTWGWLRKWQVKVARKEEGLDRVRGYNVHDVESILNERVRHFRAEVTDGRNDNNPEVIEAIQEAEAFTSEWKARQRASQRGWSPSAEIEHLVAARKAARQQKPTPPPPTRQQPSPPAPTGDPVRDEVEAALARAHGPKTYLLAPRDE